jgi:ADP-Ribosyltransferase in polyvalent proteins
MRYRELITETNIPYSSKEDQAIRKTINARFAGKAKVIHIDQAQYPLPRGQPWFTFIVTERQNIDKIKRSLTDLARTLDRDIHISDENTELPDGTPHGQKLLAQAKKIAHLDELREQNPKLMLLVVFFTPKAILAPPAKGYYHVSRNADVAVRGIPALASLKYKGRVYLWTNMQSALQFAQNSHHQANQESYVWQVTAPGETFIDPEYSTNAVYTNHPIPKDHVKLFRTITATIPAKRVNPSDYMPTTNSTLSQRPPLTKAFWHWFGESKVVDAQGQPLVMYHGTGADIEAFDDMVWGSVTPKLANDYAISAFELDKHNVNIIPLYMKIEYPLDADAGLLQKVSIDAFFGAVIEQAAAIGLQTVDRAAIRELLKVIHAASEREGWHNRPFERHNFWQRTSETFGEDGAKAILDLYQLLGFDGIKMNESGRNGSEITYGVFQSAQAKSIYNKGFYNSNDPRISEQRRANSSGVPTE